MRDDPKTKPVEELISKRALFNLLDDLNKVKKELKEQLRERAVLAEVVVAVNSTLNLKEVLSLIARKTAELCNVYRCNIFLLDETKKVFEPVMSQLASGESNERLWKIFKEKTYLPAEPVDQSRLIRETVGNHRPFIIEDPLKAEFLPDRWLEPFGVKLLLAVPLCIKDKVIGMLTLDYVEEGKCFTEGQIKRATAIAEETAMAIENARLHRRIQALAITDGLTGLYNHRYFHESLSKELARAGRYRRALSLIMLDIDYFKRYNDTYGHPKGDIVLQRIAQILTENLRKPDIAVRYGGEEMAIILPEADKESTGHTAERIRSVVEGCPFGEEQEEKVKITVSLGVAVYPEDARSKEELIVKADHALYRAKDEGRNRVCLA